VVVVTNQKGDNATMLPASVVVAIGDGVAENVAAENVAAAAAATRMPPSVEQRLIRSAAAAAGP